MQDASFTLEPALFAPTAPFKHAFVPGPWRWVVRDATNTTVATARTRRGARAALRQLYSLPEAA